MEWRDRGGWMRIKSKILSVPVGDADRRPLPELHHGKRETANTETSAPDAVRPPSLG